MPSYTCLISRCLFCKLEQEGYHFSEGRLTHNGEQLVIKELSLYNGAISVGSYITDTAELFIDDFIEWAREALHARPFVRAPKKIYNSQVTVCFAQPLSGMLRGFSRFSNVLSGALEAHAGTSKPVDLIRIGLGIDQSTMGTDNIVQFSLERRTQISFEEEWYFSEAPLPSGVHVELLKELENFYGCLIADLGKAQPTHSLTRIVDYPLYPASP